MANEVRVVVTAQDKTKGVMGGLKTSFSVISKGAAAAGAAIVVGLGKSVMAASDLNETVNKSSVIFGKMQPVVAKFARTAAQDLGMTQQQAMEAAASFGDMFLQLGFVGKEATRMSLNVVRLSADLGSFNNLPTADVQERIAAAFRGEYDSLQALVPTISAATVQQRAMADTGKKNAEKLTQQEKAAATLAIIMDSTSRAQGDFAKTSDGLANKLKIIKSQIGDIAANLGKRLLPIVGKAAKKFSEFLEDVGPAMDDFLDKFDEKKISKFFKNFSKAADKTTSELIPALKDLAATVKDVTKDFGGGKGLGGMLGGYASRQVDKITGLLLVLNATAKLVGPGIRGLARVFGRAMNDIQSNTRRRVLQIERSFWNMAIGALRAAQRMFSWIPGMRGKFDRAIAAARHARDGINAALRGIDRNVRITIGAYWGGSASAISAWKSKHGGRLFAQGGNVSAAAAGGPQSNMVMVGERGPELVSLPGGSHVFPNGNTESMMRGGRGGRPIHITVHAPNYVGAPADLLRALVDAKRRGQLDVILR